MNNRRSWSIPFQVDAGLLVQLGEELVTDRAVALAELVKNAYDADATRVTITLDKVTTKGGRIVVADNGLGMSPAAVRDHWMSIATPSKQKVPQSKKYKRLRAGSKGIGRFATRCLAHQLALVTTASDAGKQRLTTTARFDWDRFVSGNAIDSVKVKINSRPASKDERTGTTLELHPARHIWHRKDVESVKRHLNTLIDPTWAFAENGNASDGFDFEIVSQEFPELSGSMAHEFLDSAWCELSGAVDPDNEDRARFELRILKGEQKGRTKTFTYPTPFPLLGESTFRIRWVVYNRDSVAGLQFNVKDLRKIGRENGGVAVYDRGFRVMGYGSPGDDWLGIDEDRANRASTIDPHMRRLLQGNDRPLLLLPATTNLYGSVSLAGHKADDFRQTPNRERFVQDDGFEQLKAFVRSGIDWMTIIYAQTTYSRRVESRSDPVYQIRSVRERIERQEDDFDPGVATEISQALRIAESSIAAQREETIGELSMLRVMASAGTMVQVFTHQLSGVLAGLESDQRALARYRSKLPQAERADFTAKLKVLRDRLQSARHQGELLGLLHGRDARKRRKRLNVRALLDEVCGAFSGYAEAFGITVDYTTDVPASLKTPPLFQAELGAILLNLVTNAIKAVKETKQRDIRVEAWRERDPDQVVIRVHDTGVGADPERWEEFFEPFVSDSKPDMLLGVGTGLGLKIVRDFLEPYEGEAHFVTPEQGWATCVELIIPEDA